MTPDTPPCISVCDHWRAFWRASVAPIATSYLAPPGRVLRWTARRHPGPACGRSSPRRLSELRGAHPIALGRTVGLHHVLQHVHDKRPSWGAQIGATGARLGQGRQAPRVGFSNAGEPAAPLQAGDLWGVGDRRARFQGDGRPWQTRVRRRRRRTTFSPGGHGQGVASTGPASPPAPLAFSGRAEPWQTMTTGERATSPCGSPVRY